MLVAGKCLWPENRMRHTPSAGGITRLPLSLTVTIPPQRGSWNSLASTFPGTASPPLSLAVTQHSLTCAHSVLQSCPALCNSMDHSPPDLSVHGTFQAKTLEWVAISFFRGSSQPRAQICISCVSCIAGRFFTAEPPGKHIPSLLLFSRPVMSNSLQPHGLQHTRPPCPSASPKFPGGASGEKKKTHPSMQGTEETWVQFLGQENSLEKGMATHPNILAWRIPCTEEPGRLHP